MSKKITDLTQLTTPATDDILAIRDTSAGSTKKITVADLLNTSGLIGHIGSSEITSSVTATTAGAEASGLALTVTVPSGGRDLELILTAGFSSNEANVNHTIRLWDGAVGSGTLLRALFY